MSLKAMSKIEEDYCKNNLGFKSDLKTTTTITRTFQSIHRFYFELNDFNVNQSSVEYLLYYTIAGILIRPMGIFTGMNLQENFEMIPYIQRRSNGEIIWLPYQSMNKVLHADYIYLMASQTKCCRITITSDDSSSSLFVYGEMNRGFSLQSPFILELLGQLFITSFESGIGLCEERIYSDCIITVDNGSLVVFICDHKDIVVLLDDECKISLKILKDETLKKAKESIITKKKNQVYNSQNSDEFSLRKQQKFQEELVKEKSPSMQSKNRIKSQKSVDDSISKKKIVNKNGKQRKRKKSKNKFNKETLNNIQLSQQTKEPFVQKFEILPKLSKIGLSNCVDVNTSLELLKKLSDEKQTIYSNKSLQTKRTRNQSRANLKKLAILLKNKDLIVKKSRSKFALSLFRSNSSEGFSFVSDSSEVLKRVSKSIRSKRSSSRAHK